MTFSEENYLKGIYHLTVVSNSEVSTNAIAEMMDTKRPPDMLKKLAEKIW
jgi:DtxR family Mn-dependent transcriptional regulator